MTGTPRLHRVRLPATPEAIAALAPGDQVLLDGDITISIGLPTHQRMVTDLAEGRPLPLDLRGGAFFHLSAYVREEPDGTRRALYMNPSTSTRYNPWMPALVRGLGLRLVGGKGGLDAASVQALRETGCAYLSFLGGGCPLLSEAIKSVVSSHWNEYISQFRLLTLRVRGLGPATVAIDAHGNSLYAQLRERADQRLPDILQTLRMRRDTAAAAQAAIQTTQRTAAQTPPHAPTRIPDPTTTTKETRT